MRKSQIGDRFWKSIVSINRFRFFMQKASFFFYHVLINALNSWSLISDWLFRFWISKISIIVFFSFFDIQKDVLCRTKPFTRFETLFFMVVFFLNEAICRALFFFEKLRQKYQAIKIRIRCENQARVVVVWQIWGKIFLLNRCMYNETTEYSPQIGL